MDKLWTFNSTPCTTTPPKGERYAALNSSLSVDQACAHLADVAKYIVQKTLGKSAKYPVILDPLHHCAQLGSKWSPSHVPDTHIDVHTFKYGYAKNPAASNFNGKVRAQKVASKMAWGLVSSLQKYRKLVIDNLHLLFDDTVLTQLYEQYPYLEVAEHIPPDARDASRQGTYKLKRHLEALVSRTILPSNSSAPFIIIDGFIAEGKSALLAAHKLVDSECDAFWRLPTLTGKPLPPKYICIFQLFGIAEAVCQAIANQSGLVLDRGALSHIYFGGMSDSADWTITLTTYPQEDNAVWIPMSFYLHVAVALNQVYSLSNIAATQTVEELCAASMDEFSLPICHFYIAEYSVPYFTVMASLDSLYTAAQTGLYDVRSHHRDNEAASLSFQRDNAVGRLRILLRKALEKNPRPRWSSGRALERELYDEPAKCNYSEQQMLMYFWQYFGYYWLTERVHILRLYRIITTIYNYDGPPISIGALTTQLFSPVMLGGASSEPIKIKNGLPVTLPAHEPTEKSARTTLRPTTRKPANNTHHHPN